MVLNGDEYYKNAESEKFNKTFDNLIGKDGDFFKEFARSVVFIGERVKKFGLEIEKRNFCDFEL